MAMQLAREQGITLRGSAEIVAEFFCEFSLPEAGAIEPGGPGGRKPGRRGAGAPGREQEDPSVLQRLRLAFPPRGSCFQVLCVFLVRERGTEHTAQFRHVKRAWG